VPDDIRTTTLAAVLSRGVGAYYPEDPENKLGPPLPPGLFDELYAIPHPWDGITHECYKGLPQHMMERTAESTILLPGEEAYLRSRMAHAGWDWRYREDIDKGVLLRIGERCPYCDNQPGLTCPVFEHMPVLRRCLPLRFARSAESSISVFVGLEFPTGQGFGSIDNVTLHMVGQRWIGAWMMLASVMRTGYDEWWSYLRKTLPARYLHLADIVTPNDLDTRGVPAYKLAEYAHPECPLCSGAGVVAQSKCSCITPELTKLMFEDVQAADNVFRPKHPK